MSKKQTCPHCCELEGKVSLFMRLYSQDRENVMKFVSDLRKDFPLIKDTTIEPLTQSMNLLIPTGSNWEVRLYFDNEADKKEFFGNEAVSERYKKASVPQSLQKIVEVQKRKPGDPVWAR